MDRYTLLGKGKASQCVCLLVAMVLLWASMASAEVKAGKEKVLNNSFVLEFSIPIDRFYTKSLTIDQTGICRLRIESNAEHRDIPAIGLYETKISPEEAEKLKNRVLKLEYTPVPQDETPLPPGITMLQVTFQSGGKKRSRSFDPYDVPKRFEVIGRMINRIEQEAMKNMISGLQCNFALSTIEIQRDRPVVITVIMKAAGKTPVLFYNPLNSPPHCFGHITLEGIRSDIAEEELQTIHRKAYQLSMQDLTSKTEFIERQELKLMPGSKLELKFKAILDWPPGEYNVHIAVESSGIREDDEMITGRIITPGKALTVTGQTKPEDVGHEEYSPPEL